MAAMPIPDTLSQRVEAFRDRGLLYQSGADEYFSQGSWLAVMYGQGIVPTGHNPLYDLQNLDQIEAGFGQIAARWRQAVVEMPGHDDLLKAKGMWGPDA